MHCHGNATGELLPDSSTRELLRNTINSSMIEPAKDLTQLSEHL